MAAQSYRDRYGRQYAMDLVRNVDTLSGKFPSQARYGLAGQIGRVAVSVFANAAEGYEQTHRGGNTHRLSIARGPLAEVEMLLTNAGRLTFIARKRAADIWDLVRSAGKMLRKLHETRLKSTATQNTRPYKPYPLRQRKQ